MPRSRTLTVLVALATTVLGAAVAVPQASAAPATLPGSGASGAATTVEGTLRRVVVDDAAEFSGRHAADAGHEAHALRTVAVAEVDGKLLRVPDSLAAGVAANKRVRLTLRTPGGLNRAAALRWAAARSAGTTAVAALAPVATKGMAGVSSLTAGVTVAGAHTLTVLPVYWSSKDTATVASLTTLAQRTADYWKQQSANKVTTTIAVRDWKLIANPGSCDYTGMYNAAMAAHGMTAGASTDHVMLYFPQRGDCSWAGLAYVGGNVIWVNGYQLLDVTAHEFGHNLGLGHANTATCTSGGVRVPLSASCSLKEYYDSADVMGYATYSDSGSLNVGFADYLGLATVTSISPTAGSATTVNLAALNSYTGTRGVKVPVTGGTVYVEFRPATGRDVRQSNWAGVQVRMITSGGAPTSRLLDMQPWDSSAFATSGSAVAMQPYYVWPVPDTSVSIKVTQVGSTATVSVVPTKGDTTKPTAAVLTSPGANSKVPSLTTVTWTAATDAGAGLGAYAVVVDGAVATRVAGDATSATLSGVASGTHTVRVDAYDNAGNVATGTAATVTVDSSVRNAPARITSPSTNTLVTASPTVSWVLDTAAATSVVLVDGAEAARTTGTSATLSGLADGVHAISVRTLDADGLTLATSTAVLVKVDGTAPTAPTAPRFTVTTATLSWTASRDASGVAGYDVRLDGTLLGRATATTYAASLPSGTHTWTVTAVDKAGNASVPATLTTTTDPTPPGKPTITSPLDGAVLATKTPAVTFTGATDADTGIAGYRVILNGAASKSLLAPDATSFSLALRDGVHRIVVAAVNGAGVATPSDTVTVTVDVTAPPAPSKVALDGTTLTWRAPTDRLTGVASYALFLDGQSAGTATGSATSATVTTPVGRHVWTVRAIDGAGNSSAAGAAPAVWRDPTPPSTPAIVGPGDGAVSARKQVTLKWAKASDDDSGILGYRVRINGVAAARLTAATAVSAPLVLAEGDNTVSVAAVNLAGVEGDEAEIAVLVDPTGASAPVITSPAAGAAPQGTTFTVTWTASVDAESGVTGYDVLVNGRVAASTDASARSATVTVPTRTSTTVSLAVRARNGAGSLTSSTAVRSSVSAAVRVVSGVRAV